MQSVVCVPVLALVLCHVVGCRDQRDEHFEGRAEENKKLTAAAAAIARTTAEKYALEAYPSWVLANPDKRCPTSLEDLAQYLNRPSLTDPWGTKFKIACPSGKGLAVISFGPDTQEGTGDDVRAE